MKEGALVSVSEVYTDGLSAIKRVFLINYFSEGWS